LTIYKEKTPIYIYAATERINKVSHKLNWLKNYIQLGMHYILLEWKLLGASILTLAS
jgi:hypothetical protein